MPSPAQEKCWWCGASIPDTFNLEVELFEDSLSEHLCDSCENKRDDQTGYCDMYCQMTGECSGVC